MEIPRQFPNWEELYQQQAVENMPWFCSELDQDLAQVLAELELNSGTALDLGTGPGTQAIALAQRGYQVTATDLSLSAIEKAQARGQETGLKINWQQDDILNSQLEQTFDFIFDRGCFHILPAEFRAKYVETVAKLLNPSGYLFLKTFSILETREAAPYRFNAEQIQDIFQNYFSLGESHNSVFWGTIDPFPHALFCRLQMNSKTKLRTIPIDSPNSGQAR